MAATEDRLARAIAHWVGAVHRHHRRAIGVVFGVTAVLLPVAVLNLGVNSDHTRMVSPDIPSQRDHHEFSKLFPILDEAILLVIDAPTPERSREAVETLTAALSARPDVARSGQQDGYRHHRVGTQQCEGLGVGGRPLFRHHQ